MRYVALILALSMSPACAGDNLSDGLAQLDQLVTKYQPLLLTTYRCRPIVGDMYYQAARSSARLEFSQYVKLKQADKMLNDAEAFMQRELAKIPDEVKLKDCQTAVTQAHK